MQISSRPILSEPNCHDEIKQGVRGGIIGGIAGGISASGLGLVLGFFLGLEELNYSFWGITTDALIYETYKNIENTGRSASEPVIVFRYTFVNNHHQPQKGFDRLPIGTPGSVGDRIRIQYIPGDNYATRLEGQRNRWTITFVVLPVFVMLALIGLLYRESIKDKRTRKVAPRIFA